MALLSISAHFDGHQIMLDEDVDLRPDAKLIVTVLDDFNDERTDFYKLSLSALAASYDEDEIEYTEIDIKTAP